MKTNTRESPQTNEWQKTDSEGAYLGCTVPAANHVRRDVFSTARDHHQELRSNLATHRSDGDKEIANANNSQTVCVCICLLICFLGIWYRGTWLQICLSSFWTVVLFFLFLTVFFCVLYPRECHLRIPTLRSPFTCKRPATRHLSRCLWFQTLTFAQRPFQHGEFRSVRLSNRGVPMFYRSPKHRNGTAEACSSASSENTAQASHAAKRPRACLVLRSICERQPRCASNGTECHASRSARRLHRIDHQVFDLSSEELPCREHAQGNLKKHNVRRWIGRTFRRWTFGHWTLDLGLGTWDVDTRSTRWTHAGRWTHLDLLDVWTHIGHVGTPLDVGTFGRKF